MKRTLRGLCLFVGLLMLQPLILVRADVGIITDSGTFTGPAQSRFLALYGENTCTVTITGTGDNYKIVPALSTTGGISYTNVPTIGGGSITANGTYSGAVTVVSAQFINGFFLAETQPMNGSVSYSITCIAPPISVSILPFRIGQVASVAGDGSATFSATFSSAFASTFGPITITPSAYNGTDNAVISCRVTTESLSAFTGICAGGQTGSTVTVSYYANGV